MKSVTEYKEILSKFKKEFGPQFGIKELGIYGSVAKENKQRKVMFHWKKWSHSLFLILKNCWNHCVNVRLI